MTPDRPARTKAPRTWVAIRLTGLADGQKPNEALRQEIVSKLGRRVKTIFFSTEDEIGKTKNPFSDLVMIEHNDDLDLEPLVDKILVREILRNADESYTLFTEEQIAHIKESISVKNNLRDGDDVIVERGLLRGIKATVLDRLGDFSLLKVHLGDVSTSAILSADCVKRIVRATEMGAQIIPLRIESWDNDPAALPPNPDTRARQPVLISQPQAA